MPTFSRLCLAFLFLCPVVSLGGDAKGKPADANPTTGPHHLTGMWAGTYYYPEGGNQEPVKFQMAIIQDGNMIVGFIKEPNTFGERKEEPWLHATFKGRFDAKSGKITWTKTYDGTAGPKHDVEYTGTASEKTTRIEGTWAIGDFQGRFTLQKQRIDDHTVDGLK